jgi:hypothetical protein
VGIREYFVSSERGVLWINFGYSDGHHASSEAQW